MEQMHSVKRTAQQAALDGHRFEYSELATEWRALEAKAQGTVAIAGLFIGGLFALFRDMGSTVPATVRTLLLIAIVTLLACVAFCLNTLRVREVKDIPGGDELDKLAKSLDALSDEEDRSADRQRRLFCDTAELWKPALKETRAANEAKAASLERAHGTLAFAVLVIGLVASASIVSPWTATPVVTQRCCVATCVNCGADALKDSNYCASCRPAPSQTSKRSEEPVPPSQQKRRQP